MNLGDQQEIGGLKADMKHALEMLVEMRAQLQNLTNNFVSRSEIDKKLETVHLRINGVIDDVEAKFKEISRDQEKEHNKLLTKESFLPYKVVLGLIGFSIVTYFITTILPKLIH